MGVEVLGVGGEVNGHGDSMDHFRTANEMNSRALLNVAAGRKKNDAIPLYNPSHPDNQWSITPKRAD